jgi:hypothetical protein
MSRHDNVSAAHQPHPLVHQEHHRGADSISHHHLSGALTEVHHARMHGQHAYHAHQNGHHSGDTAHHHLPHLALHHQGKDVSEHGASKHASGESHRSTASPSSTGFTDRLFSELGVKDTKANRDFINAWQHHEGGAKFNPLNTSMRAAGAYSFNHDGVKAYPSMETGVHATAATLRLPAYRGILTALKNGNDAHGAAAALQRSPWGTKGNIMRA